MAVYLVRHGRPAAGTEALDPGLDDVGHQQAAAAGHALARTRAGRLIVSPLRRTRETAAPIADMLGLEPELRDEIAEVFDPTLPVDQRLAMIAPLLAGHWSHQTAALRSWRERVVSAVRDLALAAAEWGNDVVIVSHFVAINAAIGAATGDDAVAVVHLPHASITSLQAGDSALQVIEAGSTAHLPHDLVTGGNTALAGGTAAG